MEVRQFNLPNIHIVGAEADRSIAARLKSAGYYQRRRTIGAQKVDPPFVEDRQEILVGEDATKSEAGESYHDKSLGVQDVVILHIRYPRRVAGHSPLSEESPEYHVTSG